MLISFEMPNDDCNTCPIKDECDHPGIKRIYVIKDQYRPDKEVINGENDFNELSIKFNNSNPLQKMISEQKKFFYDEEKRQEKTIIGRIKKFFKALMKGK